MAALPLWTKRDIHPNFSSWTASDPHMDDLKSQELSPVGLFELFFDEGMINFIVNETNRYARQKNVSLGATAQELKCVLGVLILSGYVSYPRRRMFWETSPDSHHRLVADAISRDRFELIFSYLHFSDNHELDASDRFSKVWPLIDRMNQNFRQHTPLEEFYSFGESLCEYFGPRGPRPPAAKSAPLGCKVWCGTTSSGYLVWFEPSQGTLFTRPARGLDLGASMVLKFADALRERGCLPYHIVFDKVFTSVKLMSILRKKGVKAIGTVREYRTEGCPLKEPRELKKMRRGSFDYKVDDREEVIVCRWHDGSMLDICSNAMGVAPMGVRGQARQPSRLRLYQDKAGGVGRLDQNMARYKVKVRGTKWYSSFMAYVLDAALNNAWQLHRIWKHTWTSWPSAGTWPACTWRAMPTRPPRAGGAGSWRPRAASTWWATGSCTRTGGRAAPSATRRPTPAARSARRACTPSASGSTTSGDTEAQGPCPSSVGKKT